VRGLSRRDPDAPAAEVLASIARQRWTKLIPELGRSPIYVRHSALVLPGIFVMGASVDTVLAGKTLSSTKGVIAVPRNSSITAGELGEGKERVGTFARQPLSKA